MLHGLADVALGADVVRAVVAAETQSGHETDVSASTQEGVDGRQNFFEIAQKSVREVIYKHENRVTKERQTTGRGHSCRRWRVA